jgi:hypothetical protein
MPSTAAQVAGFYGGAVRGRFATVRAWRSANWAVGGHGFPLRASVTEAQSPTAQTPGTARHGKVVSTMMAPRLSFSIGRVCSQTQVVRDRAERQNQVIVMDFLCGWSTLCSAWALICHCHGALLQFNSRDLSADDAGSA